MTSTVRECPSPAHESRVALLTALRDLAGYTSPCGHSLPDGSRPDVLGCDRAGRGLFIGEAKASEVAGDTDALVRLSNYMKWWRVGGRQGPSVVAVCCDGARTRRWAAALGMLADELDRRVAIRSTVLDRDYGLVWAVLPEVDDGRSSATPSSSSGW